MNLSNWRSTGCWAAGGENPKIRNPHRIIAQVRSLKKRPGVGRNPFQHIHITMDMLILLSDMAMFHLLGRAAPTALSLAHATATKEDPGRWRAPDSSPSYTSWKVTPPSASPTEPVTNIAPLVQRVGWHHRGKQRNKNTWFIQITSNLKIALIQLTKILKPLWKILF
jgi:hypothetical protein